MNILSVEFNSVSQHKTNCLSANKRMNKQTYCFNTITRQTGKNKYSNNNNNQFSSVFLCAGKTVIGQITERQHRNVRETQLTNKKGNTYKEIKADRCGLLFNVSGLRKITCSCIYCQCGLNQLSLHKYSTVTVQETEKEKQSGESSLC